MNSLFSLQRPLILDGALGTELRRYDVDTSGPCWSATVVQHKPEIVTNIHERYIHAGAHIITTNTFRTNAYSLEKIGLSHMASLFTKIAVDCAKKARRNTKSDVLIAGSMGPLGDCYSPEEVPTDSILEVEHLSHAHNLMESGCDLLLVETMNSVREAVHATRCAKKCCETVLVSFVCKNGKLLSGERLSVAIGAVTREKPTAILVNCMTPHETHETVKLLRALCTVPYGAYANGKAVTRHWDDAPRLSIDVFADHLMDLIGEGCSIVGGCCGTSPEHIAEITARLDLI